MTSTKRARLAATPPAENDSDGITRMIALTELTSHPENPRGADVGDVTELASSIGSHGVLEPLVVVSIEAFIAAHDHLQVADADVTHVVVAGHRRLAAAQLAAIDEVPVVIRDDLADDGKDVEVMVAENLHREDLTPLQEARAFAQLRQMGRSQRQIAAAIGCGQSHVSKRLALLDLPEAGQKAMTTGQITPSAAEALLKLRDHPEVLAAVVEGIVEDLPEVSDDPAEQDLDGPVDAREVEFEVQRALREIEQQQRAEQTRTELAEQGVQVLSDEEIHAAFGRRLYDHRLYDEKKVEKVRAAGTLVAGIDLKGNPAYYTTKAPAAAKANNREAAEREEAKQRAAAMKARAAACGRLVKTVPAKDALLSVLSGAILARHVDAACLDMAHRWLTEHGIGAELLDQDESRFPATDHYVFERAVQASGDVKLQAHLAYAMAIASQENRTRSNYRPWDQTDADYLQLLADKTGYRPTPWESARLAGITDNPDGEGLVDGQIVNSSAPSVTMEPTVGEDTTS